MYRAKKMIEKIPRGGVAVVLILCTAGFLSIVISLASRAIGLDSDFAGELMMKGLSLLEITFVFVIWGAVYLLIGE